MNVQRKVNVPKSPCHTLLGMLRREHCRIWKDGEEVCGARVIVDEVVCSGTGWKASGRCQELIVVRTT